MSKHRIAILASGSGTNAENIIKYFKHSDNIKVECVLSNNKNAGVLQRVKKYKIETFVFSKPELNEDNSVLNYLQNRNIDLIVLAGFLWLIPKDIIQNFRKKIINIHPALLPKYGGKGMYGDNVHKAVISNQEKESGISIHYVNEKFDEGEIIFQKSLILEKNETADSLAQKIHELEYTHFPRIIEEILK